MAELDNLVDKVVREKFEDLLGIQEPESPPPETPATPAVQPKATAEDEGENKPVSKTVRLYNYAVGYHWRELPQVSSIIFVALLLIVSASRFLAPNSAVGSRSSVHLHAMIFPFFSDRNSLWTYLSVTSKHSSAGPAVLPVPCCCLHTSQVSIVCCPF